MAAAGVPKLYRSVIEDVINGVKDIFLDEGVDDQALQELRQIWEKKLIESKAVDNPEHPLPVAAVQHNARATVQPVVHHTAAATILQQHQTQQHQQHQQQQQHQHQQQQQHQQQHQQQQQQQQVNAGNQLAAQVVSSQNPWTQNAIAHQLTIGPNGIVQPTVLQYHSTTTAGGKLTITLPAQTQHGMQTVMYPHQVRHSSPAQGATLTLHPDHMASLLHGGMLSMSQAGAIQAAQRAAAGGMGNAGAVGGLQFHQVMKPMGDQQQPQYTVVTTGGQPVVTTTASPSTITTVLAPPTTTSQPLLSVLHLGPPAKANQVIQLDGANDTSDEEEEEDDFQDNEEDKDDNDDDQADEDNEDGGDEEVEPLNSDDDVSDEEATENFEIDNVVVCQYDKISRSRNRWKFHFKDGIMNLQGKDYVFQKAVGDAEW